MLISKLLPDANAVSHSNQLNANVNDNELNDEETRNFIDEPFTDSNNLDINHLMDNLREEIKYDENIAQKSALLLKLVEVSDISYFCPVNIKLRQSVVDLKFPKFFTSNTCGCLFPVEQNDIRTWSDYGSTIEVCNFVIAYDFQQFETFQHWLGTLLEKKMKLSQFPLV